jgi:mannosyl-3-phosphoglycerate phosphatase
MKVLPEQYIVFTGLDGDMIDPHPETLHEVLPALELLQSRDIPLIGTTVRSAAEILPIIKALDFAGPFIVENGSAIYIPTGFLELEIPFQKKVDHYDVIEIGLQRDVILQKLVNLRQKQGFKVTGYSELSDKEAANYIGIRQEEMEKAKAREYSEPLIFEGDEDDMEQLKLAAEAMSLRIWPQERYYVLSGDHDCSDSARLLLQFYREQYPDQPLISIGLGDNFLSAPLLYAVDIPVLVRQLDGRFDDQVGRRGLKFTRDPGPVGWNQAVIALVTQDQEA